MNTNDTGVNKPQRDDLLKKTYPGAIAFAVGILLFLLPFAEFKCGAVPVLGNTGIGIATGNSWKVSAGFGMNELIDQVKDKAKEGKEMMKDGPNIFAIVSLVAALFGLAISFTKFPWRFTAAMCAGILAALMLLSVMIQFRIQLKGMLRDGGTGNTGMDLQGVLQVQFTAWYYLSVVAFSVAAFLHYRLDKLALREAIERSIDFEFQTKKEDMSKAKE